MASTILQLELPLQAVFGGKHDNAVYNLVYNNKIYLYVHETFPNQSNLHYKCNCMFSGMSLYLRSDLYK